MTGNKLKWAAILGAIFILAGCDTTPSIRMGRDKAGASQQEFEKTRYQCIKEASSRVVSGNATADTPYRPGYQSNVSSQVIPSCQMYRACMSSNGYYLVQNGRFDSPVDCNNP